MMDNLNNNSSYPLSANCIPHETFKTTVETVPYSHLSNCINPSIVGSPLDFQNRMKDRQIDILTQKNNQLMMDLISLQQQLRNSHYPHYPEFFNQTFDRYSSASNQSDNLHMQIRLLTTALNEKTEELRQAKEEHELVMQERASVHRDLRDQSQEIESYKKQNESLVNYIKELEQEKLHSETANQNGVSMLEYDEKKVQNIQDLESENEYLRSQLITINDQHRKSEINNGKLMEKLDSVINKCYNLTKSKANCRINVNNEESRDTRDLWGRKALCTLCGNYKELSVMDLHGFRPLQPPTSQISAPKTPTSSLSNQDSAINLTFTNNTIHTTSNPDNHSNHGQFQELTVNVNVRELKLFLLNIAPLEICTDSNNKEQYTFKNNEHICCINEINVEKWDIEQIMDYLKPFNSSMQLSIIIRQNSSIFGRYMCTKLPILNSSVPYIYEGIKKISTPLYFLNDAFSINEMDLFCGDIIMLNTQENYLTVLRLEKCSYFSNSSSDKRIKEPEGNLKTSPPVLPKKKNRNKSRPLSEVCSFSPALHMDSAAITAPSHFIRQYSHGSTRSVPPPTIPPRVLSTNIMATSLYSDSSNHHKLSYTNSVILEDKDDNDVAEATKIANKIQDGSVASNKNSVSIFNEMSDSFTDSFDTYNKLPKLGKVRTVTIRISTNSFNLRTMGLEFFVYAPTNLTPNNSIGNITTSNTSINSSTNTNAMDISTEFMTHSHTTTHIFISKITHHNSANTSTYKLRGLYVGDELLSINNQTVIPESLDDDILIFENFGDNCNGALVTGDDETNYRDNVQNSHNNRAHYVVFKVQFNPKQMYKLHRQRQCYQEILRNKFSTTNCSNSNIPLLQNRNSVNVSNDNMSHMMVASIYGNSGVSRRINIIRSSSQVDIVNNNGANGNPSNSTRALITDNKKSSVVSNNMMQKRIIKVPLKSMLKKIKILGGCRTGLFVEYVEYIDSVSSLDEQGMLQIGDRLLELGGIDITRSIGEVGITNLNKMCADDELCVVQDMPSFKRLQNDMFIQESFYIEAGFSFNSQHPNIFQITTSGTSKHKSVSILTFQPNIHLSFSTGDILFIDATILKPIPISSSACIHDYGCHGPNNHSYNCSISQYLSNNMWHAWRVDQANKRIVSGLIPSAIILDNINHQYSSNQNTPNSLVLSSPRKHRRVVSLKHLVMSNQFSDTYSDSRSNRDNLCLHHHSHNCNNSTVPSSSRDNPVNHHISASRTDDSIRSSNRRFVSLSQKLFSRMSSIRRSGGFHATSSVNSCGGVSNSANSKPFHQFSFSDDVTRNKDKLGMTNKPVFYPLLRIQAVDTPRRPLVLLGPHSSTIYAALIRKWPHKFKMELTEDGIVKHTTQCHFIMDGADIQHIQRWHRKSVYPIVIALFYKSVRTVRKFKLDDNTYLKVNKRQCSKLISSMTTYVDDWSYMINRRLDIDNTVCNESNNTGSSIPDGNTNDSSVVRSNLGDICESIDRLVESVQKDDVWLRTDQYEYSNFS